MKNWEDLTLIQKVLIGTAIIAVSVLSPEIAMLVQFGGIEVAFAFLLFALKPLMLWWLHWHCKLKNILALAVISLRHSASAKPNIFALQASFCCVAFVITGSSVLALSFFMPSMLFNGILA
jgi:hypothetical protein